VRNTRTLKGFLFSFLLHLLIFALFFLSFEEIKRLPPSSSKKETKISLNLSQFTPPAPKPTPRPTPPPSPVVPTPPKPMVKTPKPTPQKVEPVAHKRVVKKEKGFEVAQKSPKENNATKIVKKTPPKPKKKIAKAKPKKRVQKKKRVAKKKPLPTTFRLPKKHTRDKLANALLGGSKPSQKASMALPRGRTGNLIRRLYGKEFYSFSKTQQKFIKDHISEIQRITQNTLVMNGYPDVAVRTGQQGVNVVSFYLHPNGDISNLRLIKRMGYQALDQNTISVIQIAYKDYPRPKTKTKIVFYVNYSLY